MVLWNLYVRFDGDWRNPQDLYTKIDGDDNIVNTEELNSILNHNLFKKNNGETLQTFYMIGNEENQHFNWEGEAESNMNISS